MVVVGGRRGRPAGTWRSAPLFFLTAALALSAAPAIFPLKDIRAGQHGVGRTVFSGTRVEEFQVEVLGVLENVAPPQSILLARVSGRPPSPTRRLQRAGGSPL